MGGGGGMSFLTDAASWCADTLKEHASIEATYTRGSVALTVNVVPGRTNDQREVPGNRTYTRVDAEWVDFHVDPSDLVGLIPAEPRQGDRLTIGSIIREVAPMEGRPPVEQSDAFNEMALVHTLRVQ